VAVISTHWIVEHIDVMKHRLSGAIPGSIFDEPDFLFRQIAEKAFSHGKIPTASWATHFRFNI